MKNHHSLLPRVAVKAIFVATILSTNIVYANVPEQCVQSPKRVEACPHILYKRAKLSITELKIVAGEMVCLCLSDMPGLRFKANSSLDKIEQEVILSRLAKALRVDQSDLLNLIRE